MIPYWKLRIIMEFQCCTVLMALFLMTGFPNKLTFLKHIVLDSFALLDLISFTFILNAKFC